jgi:hypothetical protein
VPRAYLIAMFAVDDVDQDGLNQLIDATEKAVRQSMAMEDNFHDRDPDDSNVEFLGVTATRLRDAR